MTPEKELGLNLQDIKFRSEMRLRSRCACDSRCVALLWEQDPGELHQL
jgi:hypothetical protein